MNVFSAWDHSFLYDLYEFSFHVVYYLSAKNNLWVTTDWSKLESKEDDLNLRNSMSESISADWIRKAISRPAMILPRYLFTCVQHFSLWHNTTVERETASLTRPKLPVEHPHQTWINDQSANDIVPPPCLTQRSLLCNVINSFCPLILNSNSFLVSCIYTRSSLATGKRQRIISPELLDINFWNFCI